MATVKHQLDVLSAMPHSTGIPEPVKIDGTNFPVWGYAFDVNDQLSWRFKASNYGSGNVSLVLDWYSRSGSTSNSTTWGGTLSVLTPGDSTSMEADGFATEATQATTVNSNAKGLTRTTIAISSLDSLAADDSVELRVRCTAKSMTGDAILVGIEVQYSDT